MFSNGLLPLEPFLQTFSFQRFAETLRLLESLSQSTLLLGLDHHFLLRVSPHLLAPESTQVNEDSRTSCRRRPLWSCKNVSRYTTLAANFSRGSAILLVHEEEAITLVELERRIIVLCVQIRHPQMIFDQLSSFSLQFFQLLNTLPQKIYA